MNTFTLYGINYHVIPASSVEAGDGTTAYGYGLFDKYMKKIVIPFTVLDSSTGKTYILEQIGINSFLGSNSTHIYISRTVKIIKSSAFHICNKIESFQFESFSMLETLEEAVLTWTSISQIEIPPFVKQIGTYSLRGNSQLNRVDYCGFSSFSDDTIMSLSENVIIHVSEYYPSEYFGTHQVTRDLTCSFDFVNPTSCECHKYLSTSPLIFLTMSMYLS